MTPPACRSCGAGLTTIFVDLGLTPISNALVPADRASAAETFYPLKSFVCDACRLVQLQDFESPEAHFHDHYVYFSSYSDTWLAHARTYADMAIERFRLGPRSRVIEVASNDGYLLQYFVKRGVPCLGVDPAANCARVAKEERGVETEVAFFGVETAKRLRDQGMAADLMVANNVLAHVPQLNDFVAGFKILLKPGGTATFEFPHVLELIQNGQFDTIYHEHYSYLSYVALKHLLSRHGLQATDVERLATHGGSLRLYVRHEADGGPSPAIDQLEREERAAGLAGPEAYAAFGFRAAELKRSLLALLIGLKSKGRRIVGYGAPAKGNTLLNFCGIRTDFLDFTVDRNVHKQGMLLPGVRIPVRPPEAIFAAKPEFVLILPWNLRNEITAQLAGIRAWGGRFIVPIPSPAILE
jgi:2-polyprenyl-3-methyl-5-hydroxy-6-metoxy-1,4-benzoquinol methylase